jgi:excisionase family DNA binding protein
MHDPSLRAAPRAPRRTDWLSLGPAARLLGVDADTLRRWADAGRIEAFTTPGGHRRFSRRSIERLISANRAGGSHGPPRLGARADRIAAAYRRRAAGPRFRIATPLDGSERQAVRLDGQGLVASLVAFLDASDPSERERIEDDATELTVDLARRMAAARVPLSDSIARFVMAREPLLEGLLRTARRRHLDADRLAAVFADASTILDRLLLAFVAAHEAASATPPIEGQQGRSETTGAAAAARAGSPADTSDPAPGGADVQGAVVARTRSS